MTTSKYDLEISDQTTKAEFYDFIMEFKAESEDDYDIFNSRAHRKAFNKNLEIVTRRHLSMNPWGDYAGNVDAMEELIHVLLRQAREAADITADIRSMPMRARYQS